MAFALPAPNVLSKVMSDPSHKNNSDRDRHIILSTEPRSLPSRRDAVLFTKESPSHLSPEESDDDMPLSPITFMRNNDYERSRLSYIHIESTTRPSSSPPSPQSPHSSSPLSPMIFSHPNVSSPSLVSKPPPVFPSAATQSLAFRLKRPLPPLPKVDTDTIGSATMSARTRQEQSTPVFRPSPSSSDDRDSDSALFSPVAPSHSSGTSIRTTTSSESVQSSKAIEAHPAVVDGKPWVSPLTIPVRAQSSPFPQSLSQPQGHPAIGQPIISPYISVTPASPVPHQEFPSFASGLEAIRQNARSASSTSIILASPHDDSPKRSGTPSLYDTDRDLPEPPRSPSPAPSFTPSVASGRSFMGTQNGKLSLKRMVSKSRLFGRRTLSSASEPAPTTGTEGDGDEEEETVVGHGYNSHSMDDRMLRPAEYSRSESPRASTVVSVGSSAGSGSVSVLEKRSMDDFRVPPRLEIAEVIFTEQGDVWEPRELYDVIPILRQLRAPGKLKI